MQYCTKCQHISTDDSKFCTCCRSRSLRPVKEKDFVFVMRAHANDAASLSALFAENAVAFEIQEDTKGKVTSLYDPEYVPGDSNVFVTYEDRERALALINAPKEEEKEPEEVPEETKKERIKRFLGSVIAALTFMVLVAITVFGADALANFLKSFFTK